MKKAEKSIGEAGWNNMPDGQKQWQDYAKELRAISRRTSVLYAEILEEAEEV